MYFSQQPAVAADPSKYSAYDVRDFLFRVHNFINSRALVDAQYLLSGQVVPAPIIVDFGQYNIDKMQYPGSNLTIPDKLKAFVSYLSREVDMTMRGRCFDCNGLYAKPIVYEFGALWPISANCQQ